MNADVSGQAALNISGENLSAQMSAVLDAYFKEGHLALDSDGNFSFYAQTHSAMEFFQLLSILEYSPLFEACRAEETKVQQTENGFSYFEGTILGRLSAAAFKEKSLAEGLAALSEKLQNSGPWDKEQAALAEEEQIALKRTQLIEEGKRRYEERIKSEQAAPLKERLARRVTLDVSEMELLDVLKYFGLKAGFFVETGQVEKRKVNLFVRDVPILEAINILVLGVNVAYTFSDNVLTLYSLEEYQKLTGKDFVNAFVRGKGRGFSDSPKNEELINFDICRAPVKDVLKYIAQVGSFNTVVVLDDEHRLSIVRRDISIQEGIEEAAVAGGVAVKQIGKYFIVLSLENYEAVFGQPYSPEVQSDILATQDRDQGEAARASLTFDGIPGEVYLTGVLWQGNSEKRSVMIEMGSSSVVYLLKQGERLGDYEVGRIAENFVEFVGNQAVSAKMDCDFR